MRVGSAVLVAVVVVLLGCSSAEPDPSGVADPGDAAGEVQPAPTEPDAPTEPETDEPSETDEESEGSETPGTPETRPCDAEVVAAIDATITGQLAAFAADDFDAAIGFASRSFRAGVDVASFRALIRENYPNLVDDAVHRTGACSVTPAGIAEVRIEVTGASGTRDDHVYLMVEEGGRWLVEAAVTPDGSDRTLT